MSNALENPFYLSLPSASVQTAEVDDAPVVDVKSLCTLESLAAEFRQLAKNVALIESHIQALLTRLALVESQVSALQYYQKPQWTHPAPMPYYPQPGPYIEPWQVPPWRPSTVWCG